MKNEKPGKAIFLVALLIIFATAGSPTIGTPETTYPEKELAAALAKFQSSYAFFEEGKKLLARGKEKAAFRQFESCIKAMPTHIYAHYYLANIHYLQRDFDQALAAVENAEKHLEFMMAVDAFNNITAIFYLAGRFQEADKYLQAAEEAGVEDRINLKLKKLIFEALGRTAEGILEQEYGPEGREGIRAARFTANVFEGQANLSPLFSHNYIVFDSQSWDAVLIDPGAVDRRIEDYIREKKLNVRLILNTHGHYDHSHANSYYEKLFATKIATSRDDAPLYKEDAENMGGKSGLNFFGQNLQAGTLAIRVYPTPGHTEGSSCFLIGGFLFSGDSLFEDTVGKINARDDAEYREKREKLARELRKIVDSLPPETQVLPGHGQSTTLLRVRENNPFLSAGQL